MKCSKHPTYKVMRKPTADCAECKMMWAIKQMTPEELAAGRLELESRRVATPESIKAMFEAYKEVSKPVPTL